MRRRRGERRKRRGRRSRQTGRRTAAGTMTRETVTTRSRPGRTGEAAHVTPRSTSAHVRVLGGADEKNSQKRGSHRRRGEEKKMLKEDGNGTERGRESETEGGKERMKTRGRGRGRERGIKRTGTGTEAERRGGGDETPHVSVQQQ